MFQKFYENTMFCGFVKQLLESEYIPKLKKIQPTTHLINDCVYLKGFDVVKCTQPGTLEDGAQITVLPNTTYTASNFVSNVSYYDSKTHKHLGNYLRHFRDSTGINLMPFYNCYNGTELSNLFLDSATRIPLYPQDDLMCSKDELHCGATKLVKNSRSFMLSSNSDYRVIAVPVKYDTTYTVAVESATGVSFRGIVYGDSMLRVDNLSSYNEKFPTDMNANILNPRGDLKEEYYSDYLEYSFKKMVSSRFVDPFTYTIPLADREDISDNIKQELYSLEEYLYMVIQIPATTKTSVVVLEGDYTLEEGKTSLWRQKQTVNNYSLLAFNTGESYAFSDRLVEYLLLNSIDSTETLSTNIRRIQESLSRLNPEYQARLLRKNAVLGIWDSRIPEFINELLENNSGMLDTRFDHDGNVNKDVEKLLSLKGVYVT